MDNSDDLFTDEWSTPPVAAGALLAGGVVLAVCAIVLAPDLLGAVVIGAAGLMLVAFGTYAALIRPRLALHTGPAPTLTIGRIGGPLVLTVGQVERIRVLSLRRIGRRSTQLEIDYLAGDDPTDDSRLIVFGRWDLGTDLLGVADELRNAGFVVEDARA